MAARKLRLPQKIGLLVLENLLSTRRNDAKFASQSSMGSTEIANKLITLQCLQNGGPQCYNSFRWNFLANLTYITRSCRDLDGKRSKTRSRLLGLEFFFLTFRAIVISNNCRGELKFVRTNCDNFLRAIQMKNGTINWARKISKDEPKRVLQRKNRTCARREHLDCRNSI